MLEKFRKAVDLYKNATQKDCYSVKIVKGRPSILDNKIGGDPYLPVGEVYPTDEKGNPLALLLQVNLKDIKLEGYPNSGILEIFTDAEMGWPCKYSVKYFKEGLDYQKKFPKIKTKEYIVTKSYKIELQKDVAHMPINDYRFGETFSKAVNTVFGTSLEHYGDISDYFENVEWDWIDELCNSLNDLPITIGGYADFTQGDPRLEGEENRDECLFKLDSNADYTKFSIGDSGILFAIISKDDILSCNFENALVDWDCC